MQATSPTMPTRITCASIWPKPATSPVPCAVGDEDAGGAQHRVDDVAGAAARTAGRCRRCRRRPGSSRARPRPRSSAASALAFCAGSWNSICDWTAALPAMRRVDDALRGVDQRPAPGRPRAAEIAFGLRRISSARVLNSSSACCSAPRAWAILPSASASCDLATSIVASTSAIRRLRGLDRRLLLGAVEPEQRLARLTRWLIPT